MAGRMLPDVVVTIGVNARANPRTISIIPEPMTAVRTRSYPAFL